MTERWVPVVDFESFYEVSDQGRVRSTDALIEVSASAIAPAHLRRRKGRVLKTTPSSNGNYPTVYLWKRHVGRRFTNHELVLTAFKGRRPEGHEGCHRNGDPTDARLDNLYWGTPQQNAQDKKQHGTHIEGEAIKWAKLTENDVREIRANAGVITQDEMAAIYGVSQGHISRVVLRQEWRHVQ